MSKVLRVGEMKVQLERLEWTIHDTTKSKSRPNTIPRTKKKGKGITLLRKYSNSFASHQPLVTFYAKHIRNFSPIVSFVWRFCGGFRVGLRTCIVRSNCSLSGRAVSYDGIEKQVLVRTCILSIKGKWRSL